MPLYSVLCTGFVDTVLICAIHRTLTEKKERNNNKKKTVENATEVLGLGKETSTPQVQELVALAG